MCICAHLDLSLPFFCGHEETKESKPQRRKASVGEAVASPALLAVSVTLQMIPHSVGCQDCKRVCRRGTGGKPYTFPLIPAGCECSIWAEKSLSPQRWGPGEVCVCAVAGSDQPLSLQAEVKP